MVRFARAHGSKGSNERVPEEATSWQDMKKQLQAISSTTDNQNGSPPKKTFVFKKTSDNVPVKWAEFEPNSQITESKTNLNNDKPAIVLLESEPKRKKSKKRKDHSEQDVAHKVSSKSLKIKKDKPSAIDRLCKNVLKKCAIDPSVVTVMTKREQAKLLKKQRKAEKLNPSIPKVCKEDADKNSQGEETNKTLSKKSLKRKRQLAKKSLPDKKGDSAINDKSDEKVVSSSKPFGVISKRQKRNMKHQLKKNANALANETDTLEKTEENPSGNTSGLVETKASKCKKERRGADKQHKRRKPEQPVTTMEFNGKYVEVVQFDGFPVRKQDADHLNELRSQMIANLIPKDEIDRTMKMERRKAEKALARERKKVCFHCRKSGHNLSECPELGDEAQHEAPPSGICYKCGSTEHTHFECRVNRGQEFRFAKCFICNEQGHISNQCPDNPRGLYPKGGGCKVCGDVTHLKKNCPDLVSKKEESGITLSTAQSAGIELLDEDMNDDDSKPAKITPKVKKVVKF